MRALLKHPSPAAQSLESLDPGNTIAAETRQKANEGLERRRRVQALLARARELIAAGDFADVPHDLQRSA